MRSVLEEHIPEIVFPWSDLECGWLAQLGEHRPYKARVTGSSPVPPTTFHTLLD